MHNNGDAVSEVAAEILILGLVVILGAVILVMVFGVIPQIPAGSYLATDISLKEMPGYSAVAIFHRAGDTLNFTSTAGMPGAAEVSIITPAGSFPAVPAAGLPEFRPGNTVYVYYTGTGYRLVSDLSGVAGVPLPTTGLRVTLVDLTSGLLITKWDLLPAGIPVTSSATTATTTTTTATTTTTTTTTTATSTATATATPTATAVTTTPAPGYSVRVSWSPPGLGYISISPPTPLANPGTVSVASGQSQTFSFVPIKKKAVSTIVVDGATVYSGATVNVTVTYALTNVAAPHTIAATFG